MSRTLVVLRLLKANEDPMRRIDLYNLANEYDEFRKYDGRSFWVEDMTYLMEGFIERGLIAKTKERNKVWYTYTERGLDFLQKSDDPKELQKRIRRKMRYKVQKYVKYSNWKDEDEMTKIDEELLKFAKRIKDKEYIRTLFYREAVAQEAYRREHGYRDEESEVATHFREKIGGWDEDKFNDDVLDLVTKRRVRDERRNEEWAKLHGRTEKCFVCGNWIHRDDVVKVAKELAERLGVETATVCCRCYDELMGGEVEVAAIN